MIYGLVAEKIVVWLKANPKTINIISSIALIIIAIIAVFASMTSYLFAQYVDIQIYHFWKNLTKGKMLWLRNNFSTFFSQFIDTFTIILLLCLSNVLMWDQFLGLLISGFLFKVLIAIIDTPFLYLGVYLFRRRFNLKINEEINID